MAEVLDIKPGDRVALRDERGAFLVRRVAEKYVLLTGPQGEWRTPAISRVAAVLPKEAG